MQIDDSVCIGCKRCRSICQIETKPVFNSPGKLYVGWSENALFRRNSASGGIAASLYDYVLKNGGYICGVSLNDSFQAEYSITNDPKKIHDYLNSKYTYSDVSCCYNSIKQKLQDESVVLFIGLPCQVAAIKNYLAVTSCPTERLITVDIVCHGTPFPSFLKDHIASIQEANDFKAKSCMFRDPQYKSSRYVFTIYKDNDSNNNRKKPIYKKCVEDDDLYQIGYHSGFIYRECCYNCQYTRHERLGDITIFDSTGLGKCEKYIHSKENTSFIFLNSIKGQKIIESAVKDGLIYIEYRPENEAYYYNGQLNKPCSGKDSFERNLFWDLIEQEYSYDEAASVAFAECVSKNRAIINRLKSKTKRFIKLLIPHLLIDYFSISKNKKDKKS